MVFVEVRQCPGTTELQHRGPTEDPFFLETPEDCKAETQECLNCHVSNECLKAWLPWSEAWQEGRATPDFSGQAAGHAAFPQRIAAGICNGGTSCAGHPQQHHGNTSRLQGGPQHYWQPRTTRR